jgi:hypothetical protein
MPNDVAPNPPPITRKQSKTQMPIIKQTAINLLSQVQFVSLLI